MHRLGRNREKKIHSELKLYFPNYFNNEDTFQFYQKIKAKIAAIAELVETDGSEAAQAKLYEIDRYFAENIKPEDFDADSTDNASVKADTTFETLCSILEGNGVANAADLSTLAFYARLEHFKRIRQVNKP